MNKTDWMLMIAFFDFFWNVFKAIYQNRLGRSYDVAFDSRVKKVNTYLDRGHR